MPNLDPSAADEDAIRQIARAYARRTRRGDVLLCTPGRNDPDRRSEGKITYLDVATAQEAAVAIERAGGKPLAVYLCNRSRHGHTHLTSQGAPRPNPDRRPADVPVLRPERTPCPRCGRPWLRPHDVPEGDPRYCGPSCKDMGKWREQPRAEKWTALANAVRGTALDGIVWSEEFRAAVKAAKTPEAVEALVAAEIARLEAGVYADS